MKHVMSDVWQDVVGRTSAGIAHEQADGEWNAACALRMAEIVRGLRAEARAWMGEVVMQVSSEEGLPTCTREATSLQRPVEI